jgi:hypothetical protein
VTAVRGRNPLLARLNNSRGRRATPDAR